MHPLLASGRIAWGDTAQTYLKKVVELVFLLFYRSNSIELAIRDVEFSVQCG